MENTSKAREDALDVVGAFAAAVRRGPDRIGVTDGERSLTYAGLDAASGALAAALAREGVGPEQLVGLELERPVELVVALLGTLKAGAAFVLVDPALGPEARERRKRAARAALWLTSERLRRASGRAGVDWETRLVCAEQLAYLIFTSGSTGEPKGIMVSRGNLGAYVRDLRDRLRLTPADTWFQVASPGFDVFVEEVLPVLAAGGTVGCRERAEPLDPGRLHDGLERTGATIVELTTQYWYEYARWLGASETRLPSRLRLVIVGGERMSAAAYFDWQSRHAVPLHHVYGLTECTITTTLYDGVVAGAAEDVPIGLPLPASRLTVRRVGAALAPGEEGEIHIGGGGVARGFAGDPAGTAARFVPDPDGHGARAYATGDRGLLLADGNAVFRGRADDQVKVRGFRLELTEVEVALASLEAVADAAVILDPATGADLVAFVVPFGLSPGPGADGIRALGHDEARPLRDELERLLPDWAVPGRFELVRELPKTPHGKVDRAALGRLCARETATAGDPAPVPLDPFLAAFRSALAAPDLGADDDFFEHGGNSLVALRIVAELRERHGVDGLGPTTIFDAPTPRKLARRVAAPA